MKIHIQEPWWSAWKKFGWAKGIWGIGINKNIVELARKKRESLIITIGNDKTEYCVSPITIINFYERNKTSYIARGNTNLYIIPQTLLSKIDS
jgi:hypothetical protein